MSTAKHDSRLWPPSEYKEAIGQICVNSAQLEASIRTVIWHVAGLDSLTGRAFTGKVRISDLGETLKSLIEVRTPHLLSQASEICTKINTLFAKRAEYVHQVWLVGNDQQPAIGKVFLERQERREVIRTVQLEEMQALAEAIAEVEGELFTQLLLPLLPKQE
jgi:hypothetical protein